MFEKYFVTKANKLGKIKVDFTKLQVNYLEIKTEKIKLKEKLRTPKIVDKEQKQKTVEQNKSLKLLVKVTTTFELKDKENEEINSTLSLRINDLETRLRVSQNHLHAANEKIGKKEYLNKLQEETGV